jgi:hypothetical protein
MNNKFKENFEDLWLFNYLSLSEIWNNEEDEIWKIYIKLSKVL